jgi:hypothetical protein
MVGDDAPINRTGPFRLSSATPIEMVSLWTSIPTNEPTVWNVAFKTVSTPTSEVGESDNLFRQITWTHAAL